jgi:hypothetical protein
MTGRRGQYTQVHDGQPARTAKRSVSFTRLLALHPCSGRLP